MSIKVFCNFLPFTLLSITLANITCNESSRWKKIQQRDVEALVIKYLPGLLESALKDSKFSKSPVIRNEPMTSVSLIESFPPEVSAQQEQDQFEEVESDKFPELVERITDLLETRIKENQEFSNVSTKNINTKNKHDLHLKNSSSVKHKRDDGLEDPLPSLSEHIRRLIPKLAKRLTKKHDLQHLQQHSPKSPLFKEGHLAETTSLLSKDTSKISLECLSSCDVFNERSKTCWFDRQVGDTITFSVRVRGITPERWKEGNIQLQWDRKRNIRASDKYTTEKLFPETASNDSGNIMVGSGGLRLRISPIEDMDVDFNGFSVSANAVATNLGQDRTKLTELTFKIAILPVDMGFVYLGEEIVIDIKNYITLPENTHKFEWRMETSFFTSLPPNMRVVKNGQVLFITELSKEQEGIVACSMYTKNDLFLAKRRFLIRPPVLATLEKSPIYSTAPNKEINSLSSSNPISH